MKNQEKLEKVKEEYLGMINKNIFGTEMKIIEYNGRNIIVEFQDEYRYRKQTFKIQFLKGTVKNPYDKEVCSIGFLGEGKYCKKNYSDIYNTWKHMLQRCYDPYTINKEPTYADCYVCESWHCFQSFAKWYESKEYYCNGERLELDKDILCKGNKIYSPENCILVPQRINKLFTKSDRTRGKYPIGVSWKKKNNKFQAQCNVEGTMKYLGLYDTFEEAFLAYKIFKESYIKQVADEYKDIIPIELYEALYNYKVEIND